MSSIQLAEITRGRRLGGSTGAYLSQWQGRNCVFKPGATGHAMNEILALRLYAAAGVRVPEEVYEVRDGDRFAGLLMSYIDGASARQLFDNGVTPPRSSALHTLRSAIERDFVVHALFANWDARNAENYMIERKGDVWNLDAPYVIDLGGALMYRAMGEYDPDRKFPEAGLRNGRGNIESLAKFAGPGRYFDAFKDTHMRRNAVCQRWRSVDTSQLLQTLDDNAHLAIDPLGDSTHEELRRRLVGRIEAINTYCAAMSTGGRRRKTRRRTRRTNRN